MQAQRAFGIPPARLLQLGTLAGLLAIWELVSASGLVYRGVVPSVTRLAPALWDLFANPSFWLNLLVTGMEIGAALAIAFVSGVLAGIALGGNRFIGQALEPYVNYVASMPKIILFPILLVIFGVGPASKIAIGAIASFFPIALSTMSGTRQISTVLIRVGHSFDLSTRQMVQMIYLPSLVDPILSGLRVALGVAIVVCLLGEMKFSNVGLGFMVIASYNGARFADMYAVLIVIFAIAIVGNAVIDRLIRQP